MYKDDRTDEQKNTHTTIIGGRDSFMTTWGREVGRIPSDGASYAFWACKPEDAKNMRKWIAARGDLSGVKTYHNKFPKKNTSDHCHIYVATELHINKEQ